jgi:[ribosomal protein S18]-alanine N-acetyltransferase
MNNEIVIRRGTPADMPAVIVMADHSRSAAHWRPEDYQAALEAERLLLIAGTKQTVIGFLVAHDIAGEWELENIVVAPAHHGLGIGKRLLQALIREAEIRNGKFIFLEVRESNAAAKRLYERCGFQQYGRRSGYYSYPSEDAVLYRFLCNPKTRENC